MKKIVILFTIALFSLQAFAGREGSGGNAIGLEFKQLGQTVIQDVRAHATDYPELTQLDLEGTLNNAQVIVSDQPVYVDKGQIRQEDTATNYKDSSTIVVNGSNDDYSWVKITEMSVKKALVLHEILGLLGVEATGNYSISQRYLRASGLPCYQGICTPTPTRTVHFIPKADEAIDIPQEGIIVVKNPHFESTDAIDGVTHFYIKYQGGAGEFCRFFQGNGDVDVNNSNTIINPIVSQNREVLYFAGGLWGQFPGGPVGIYSSIACKK